ncbi:Uncharacterised protein [[Eubacterium] infirmum]|nr:Uncharacterised protein [[Eubacterium] infirmum]
MYSNLDRLEFKDNWDCNSWHCRIDSNLDRLEFKGLKLEKEKVEGLDSNLDRLEFKEGSAKISQAYKGIRI